MCEVNRNEFLQVLQYVNSATATKVTTAQSDCIVFKDNQMFSYNDELACQAEAPFDLECVVKASPLIKLLERLPDELVSVSLEAKGLQVKGKRKRGTINVEMDILLPMEVFKEPSDWIDVPEGFSKALKTCAPSVGKDVSRFNLMCIHLNKGLIESCDGFQFTRVYLTEGGLENETFIRGAIAKKIVDFNALQYSADGNWLRFSNEVAVLSCRQYNHDYPRLDVIFDAKGTLLELPKNIKEILKRTDVFGDGMITATFTGEIIKITSSSDDGDYEEKAKCEFVGDPFQVTVNSKLFNALIKNSNEVIVGDKSITITTGNEMYVIALNKVKEEL